MVSNMKINKITCSYLVCLSAKQARVFRFNGLGCFCLSSEGTCYRWYGYLPQLNDHGKSGPLND